MREMLMLELRTQMLLLVLFQRHVRSVDYDLPPPLSLKPFALPMNAW